MTERLPDVLTEDEWKAFIRQFNLKAPTSLRNACLFTLMRDAGLRTCEVVGLKITDVKHDELDGEPITLLEIRATKGGNGNGNGEKRVARVVYLTDEAERLLAMWLERKSQLGLGRAKHVFTTLKGEPLEGAYLREVCARKGAAAGITWRLHPHALRHSFAVDLLEHTGNLAMVQDALGHRDPRTTRIYAKVRNSSLARAMARRKQLAQPDRQALTDRLADLQRQIAELQEQIGGDER